MKSKETTCHAVSGTGSGEKSPGYGTLSGLACWQTEHWETKSATNCFSFGQANNFLIRWQVASKTEWPPNGLAWRAVMILWRKSCSDPNHNLSLNLIRPLFREKWPTGEETESYCSKFWQLRVLYICSL
jgi:hypothetical protein